MAGALPTSWESTLLDIDVEEPVVGFRSWQMCSAPVVDGLLTTKLGGGFNGPMLVAGESHGVCLTGEGLGSHSCPEMDWLDVNCGIPICDVEQPDRPVGRLLHERSYRAPRRIHGLLLGWGRTVENEPELWRWRVERARLVALAIAPEWRHIDHAKFRNNAALTPYMRLPNTAEIARLPDPGAWERPSRFPLLPMAGLPHDPAGFWSQRDGALCDPEWAVRLARRYEVPLVDTIEDLAEIAVSVPQRVYAGSSGTEMPPRC